MTCTNRTAASIKQQSRANLRVTSQDIPTKASAKMSRVRAPFVVQGEIQPAVRSLAPGLPDKALTTLRAQVHKIAIKEAPGPQLTNTPLPLCRRHRATKTPCSPPEDGARHTWASAGVGHYKVVYEVRPLAIQKMALSPGMPAASINTHLYTCL